MKKVFENPEIEITYFSLENVVTTSAVTALEKQGVNKGNMTKVSADTILEFTM